MSHWYSYLLFTYFLFILFSLCHFLVFYFFELVFMNYSMWTLYYPLILYFFISHIYLRLFRLSIAVFCCLLWFYCIYCYIILYYLFYPVFTFIFCFCYPLFKSMCFLPSGQFFWFTLIGLLYIFSRYYIAYFVLSTLTLTLSSLIFY